MKDPIILCPICAQPGGHIRKKDGVRCLTDRCGLQGKILVADLEVQRLKQQLKAGIWSELKSWIHDLQEMR